MSGSEVVEFLGALSVAFCVGFAAGYVLTVFRRGVDHVDG